MQLLSLLLNLAWRLTELSFRLLFQLLGLLLGLLGKVIMAGLGSRAQQTNTGRHVPPRAPRRRRPR